MGRTHELDDKSLEYCLAVINGTRIYRCLDIQISMKRNHVQSPTGYKGDSRRSVGNVETVEKWGKLGSMGPSSYQASSIMSHGRGKSSHRSKLPLNCYNTASSASCKSPKSLT